MLEIRDLRGGWGLTTIVEDFSFTLAAGETVAVVGRNGVGKSTLLELVVGRARRFAGEIALDRNDLAHLSIHERVHRGLAYVPQRREIFPRLTVAEHLTIAVRPGRWNEEGVLALFPRLAERRRSLGGQLSGGEQQMLAIARALLTNPRVLLMDEPFEGLAPVVVEQMLEVLGTVVKDSALSVLLVEQRVDIALRLSSRCVVMDRGRIVHQAQSAELQREGFDWAALMGLAV
jgi:branched-chain amino acid transport system ATP-binding protein